MTYQQTLEDLALGELTAEEGLAIVRRALDCGPKSASQDIYEAVRAWLWKALWTRRTDDGLREWLTLMTYTSRKLNSENDAYALKIEAFIELLRASIRKGEIERDEDPLTRKHAAETLRFIASRGSRVRRSILRDALGLKAANLSRVMGPLIDRGYVDVERRGREITYRLTEKGRSLIPAAPLRATADLDTDIASVPVNFAQPTIELVSPIPLKNDDRDIIEHWDVRRFDQFHVRKGELVAGTAADLSRSGRFPVELNAYVFEPKQKEREAKVA